MKFVILFSGEARHGKDSSAMILKEKLEKCNKKVLIMHFADLLKFYCKTYFGWDGNKDEKGRQFLQYFGTDLVRKKDPDFWVNSVINFIKLFQDDYDYFIMADCRYPNEIMCFKDNYIKSLSVKVVRLNFENDLTPEQRQHQSERSLDNFKFDYIIKSESGLENLSVEVDKFFEFYKGICW